MLGWNDMQNMAKVLKDVIKPGAYQHVFCSALHLPLQYKALPPKRRKRETETGEIPAREGLGARRART